MHLCANAPKRLCANVYVRPRTRQGECALNVQAKHQTDPTKYHRYFLWISRCPWAVRNVRKPYAVAPPKDGG